MKRIGKVANFIMILTIIFLLIGMSFTLATENEGENQNEVQGKANIDLEQSVEKYFKLESASEEVIENEKNINNVLIQEKILVRRNENNPKIENENLEVVLPVLEGKQAESVVVLTNGIKLGENSFTYDVQNGILRITLDEENELDNIGKTEDIYQVIARYSNIENLEETKIVNLKTTLYTKCENIEEITTTKEDEVEIGLIGESLSLDGEITENISKGYLYQGSVRDTNYLEKYEVQISNIENIESINITNDKEIYIQETEEERNEFTVNNNTYYKGILVSKENLERILGNEGKIIVKDISGNILVEINKDTQTDENGNINIEYGRNDLNRVQIEITKPVQEGNLEIFNVKAMKAETGYSKQDLSRFNKYEETIKVNNITKVLTMNMKDTEAKAELQINKEELSTMQENQEIEVKAILNVTNETMELYTNPLIEIKFPDEVENITIKDNVSILYEDELKIVNTYVEGKTVYIELEGEQTKYKEEIVNGAEINFKVNLNLNKRATNSNKEIVLKVTDRESSKVAETRKGVKIVSPRDMIAINSIEEVGVETFGDETNKEVTLNRNNDTKQVKVTGEIINNKENIQDVKILGDMIGNDSENNLNAIITSPVTVEGNDVKVYYTENENADEDLNNTSNGWVEDSSIVNSAKKYLVVSNSMNTGDTIKTAYTAQIPESLEYDQKATEGYEISFTDEKTTSNKVRATDVTLTTGQGPTLEGNLTASVGQDTLTSGDAVKVGEVIYYNLALTNTGSEAATNVTVNVLVPESMTLLEEKPPFISGEDEFENDEDKGFVYGTGFYYELEDRVFTTTIETIDINETKNITFLYRANAESENTISVKPEVNYNEDVLEVNGIDVIVGNGDLQVFVKSIDDYYNPDRDELVEGIPSGVHKEKGVANYAISVKNMSEETKNNIEVNFNIPSKLTLKEILIDGVYLDSISNPLVISSLAPGQEEVVRVTFEIGEIEQKEEKISLAAIVSEENGESTRTNEFVITAYGVFLDLSLTATNENGFIKTDDEIQYKLTIKNDGVIPLGGIFIEDEISSELTIVTATSSDETDVQISGNKIYKTIDLGVGESLEITINTVVNYSDSRTEDIDITNQAVATNSGYEFKSNVVTHTIEASKVIDPDDPDNPDNPDPDNPDNPNPDNPDDPDNPQNIYSIRGTAWLDENSDGEMQDKEQKIPNMRVMLLNVENNELVKDDNGNNLIVTTNDSGVYTFAELEPSNYIVVFDFDSNRYNLAEYQKEGVSDSRNSDVVTRQLNIEGETRTYAVTDTIEITNRSIANISIGLIEAKELDLQINKSVTRIVMQSASGTRVTSFNNTNLARVEMDAKEANNTSIVIEYEIAVTNVGEVPAYVRKIVDKIPEGFEFSSELNKDWYLSGNEVHNVTLANEQINPDETRRLTLILTKDMTENTTGTYTNTVEIVNSYSETGIQDLNSSNDTSSAETIIGIRTGGVILNIALIIVCIVIVGVGVYFIKKKVLN